MTPRTILPSRNPASGFWAASVRNGYDVEGTWAAASQALTAVFQLRPAEVRDLLDSDAGGLLAEDIGFIDGDTSDPQAVEGLLRSRLDHLGWRRLYIQAIAAIRAENSGTDIED